MPWPLHYTASRWPQWLEMTPPHLVFILDSLKRTGGCFSTPNTWLTCCPCDCSTCTRAQYVNCRHGKHNFTLWPGYSFSISTKDGKICKQNLRKTYIYFVQFFFSVTHTVLVADISMKTGHGIMAAQLNNFCLISLQPTMGTSKSSGAVVHYRYLTINLKKSSFYLIITKQCTSIHVSRVCNFTLMTFSWRNSLLVARSTGFSSVSIVVYLSCESETQSRRVERTS